MMQINKRIWVLIMCLILAGCLKGSGPQVCFQSSCVNVELALTDEQLRTGLQYRKDLPWNTGMLFVFDRPVQADFWMKNTLIPLDMIWLDEQRTVIHIQKNAAPCFQEKCPTYGPNQQALYVLEVNAGYADARNIQVGDTAIFSHMERK